MQDWTIYEGKNQPHDGIDRLPPPPPWRPFRAPPPLSERKVVADDALSPKMRHTGRTFRATDEIVDVVNAALYLRRPLLVTGKPGSGKSSLIDAVAYELRLGEPLRWAVTSRSALRDALYLYDAVGRLQEQQQRQLQPNAVGPASSPDDTAMPPGAPSLTSFLRLGPLGTALLPTDRPRALLIDEIDKADLDLPNDLLNVLEEGMFEIPELARLGEELCEVRVHGDESPDRVQVRRGRIAMRQFPLVVMTSNGERDFPQAFLRRCLRLDMPDPCADDERLAKIVEAQLAGLIDPKAREAVEQQIKAFATRAKDESLSTDQLLNAIYLIAGKAPFSITEPKKVLKHVTRRLDG